MQYKTSKQKQDKQKNIHSLHHVKVFCQFDDSDKIKSEKLVQIQKWI